MNTPRLSALHKHYNQVAGQSLESLVSLSNNIFAFSMTLLVLEIRLPAHDPIHNDHDLFIALHAMFPHVTTWLMSLLTLGIYWVGQQTQLNHLKHSNLRYAWIQLTFLAFVTAIPFSTRLLNEFIDYRLALLIYWGNIFALGMMVLISWNYSAKKDLLKSSVTKETFNSVNRRIVRAQILYALGAALCLINPYWSIGFIVIVQLNYALTPKIPFICELTA
jgi:uncharacterized membrane protein